MCSSISFVVLIRISSMMYGVEHPFICSLSICVCFLVGCPLKIFGPFFNQVFFLIVLRFGFTFCITVLYQICLLQILSPSL